MNTKCYRGGVFFSVKDGDTLWGRDAMTEQWWARHCYRCVLRAAVQCQSICFGVQCVSPENWCNHADRVIVMFPHQASESGRRIYGDFFFLTHTSHIQFMLVSTITTGLANSASPIRKGKRGPRHTPCGGSFYKSTPFTAAKEAVVVR